MYQQRPRSISPFERVDGIICRWLTRFNFRDVSKRTLGTGIYRKGKREKVPIKGERVVYKDGTVEFVPRSKELFIVKCK